jgi:hypothetical protein
MKKRSKEVVKQEDFSKKIQKQLDNMILDSDDDNLSVLGALFLLSSIRIFQAKKPDIAFEKIAERAVVIHHRGRTNESKRLGYKENVSRNSRWWTVEEG